jgi:hypothetical protein
MSYIYPIKFSFGTNIHREITIGQLEYLRMFFSSYFNHDYQIDESSIEKYKSIPISYGKISKFSNILSAKLSNYLINEYQILSSDKIFKNADDLVIIDIKANVRNVAIIGLSGEIEAILCNDSNLNPRFVIIVDNLPSISDSFLSIREYVSSGKVLLIDKKKRFKYKEEKYVINKSFSFESLSKSALDKIKFKLLRKIGHYGRFEDQAKTDLTACNQYFYDGSDCESDISDLLFDKIVEYQEKYDFKISKIIYDCVESPWLENAITLLNSDLNSLKIEYNFNYKDYGYIRSINDVDNSYENILFIIDLIHSGKTFKNQFSRLRQFFPNSNIRSISILFSDDGLYFESKDNHIKVESSEDNSSIVEFLLSVSQRQYVNFQKCPMCQDLQMNVINESSFINDNVLSSFETWTMCDEAGYIPEDWEPGRDDPYPTTLSIKPNSLSLIQENAAFLALKYIKHIERNKLLQSPDLTLIFPDETSNKKEIERRGSSIRIEDTPSGYFAETLMQLKQIEYFGIPRVIITRLKDKSDKFNLARIPLEYKNFYNKLTLLSDDIIIMDEFGLSGGTLREIVNILSIVNKVPKAYFPIFNFSPKSLNDSSLSGLKVLSLYDFNLKFN